MPSCLPPSNSHHKPPARMPRYALSAELGLNSSTMHRPGRSERLFLSALGRAYLTACITPAQMSRVTPVRSVRSVQSRSNAGPIPVQRRSNPGPIGPTSVYSCPGAPEPGHRAAVPQRVEPGAQTTDRGAGRLMSLHVVAEAAAVQAPCASAQRAAVPAVV